MKLAVSTSGPVVLVAVERGGSVETRSAAAERNATSAVLSLLHDLGIDTNQVTEFHVDVGPGSFTGVRVGVTMVKVWAHLASKPVFCHTSFDLADPTGPVSIPSRKGEAFYRVPGQEPCVVASPGALEPPRLNIETAFALPGEPLPAEAVVPLYVAQPNISQAKSPQIMGETFA